MKKSYHFTKMELSYYNDWASNSVNNRGMIELVIAAIGLELGIIDITLFGIIVAIGFITIIMAQ